jgi:hypothetical protein
MRTELWNFKLSVVANEAQLPRVSRLWGGLFERASRDSIESGALLFFRSQVAGRNLLRVVIRRDKPFRLADRQTLRSQA